MPQKFLKVFPPNEKVFCNPVERYARHINPLVSIDLSSVDVKLDGWVHLVSPIEPCDGYLGDSGKEYYGSYLQPNWIGFHLTNDCKYELAGDFRFFGIENTEGKESYPGARQELEKFYKKQHESFIDHKAAHKEVGQVCRVLRNRYVEVDAVSQLGGVAPVSNMTWLDVPGCQFTYSDKDAAPRTKDGRLFLFIASVPGWHYRNFGADDILLYYDPIERIALQTFVFG